MNNVLYDNAIYYKEKIIPYIILLKGKNGNILVETSEKDFAHLVGKSHSKNLAIHHMSSFQFWKKVLKKEISIYDMLLTSQLDYLDNEQNIILQKNIYFKETFESLFEHVNIKVYHDHLNLYSMLSLDYFHGQESIEYTNILGIRGNVTNDFYSFITILHLDTKENMKSFTNQKRRSFDITKIHKSGFNIDDFEPYIKSKRNVFHKRVLSQKNDSKREIKKLKKRISLLLKDDLTIGIGMYGKNSIQVYKNGEIIETRLSIDNSLKTSEAIANFINEKYTNQIDNSKK